MDKIKESNKGNKLNKILTVTGGVLIAVGSYKLGRMIEAATIINGLKRLGNTDKMKFITIDGERYILSMMKESELINKYK